MFKRVGSIFFAFLFQQGVVWLREEWTHIFVQPLKLSIF